MLEIVELISSVIIFVGLVCFIADKFEEIKATSRKRLWHVGVLIVYIEMAFLSIMGFCIVLHGL